MRSESFLAVGGEEGGPCVVSVCLRERSPEQKDWSKGEGAALSPAVVQKGEK